MVVVKHWLDTRNEPIQWHFWTVRDALKWRNAKIGSDNPSTCDGDWVLYLIGPDTLPDGELVLSVLEKWKFVGQWADDGNAYAITGIELVDGG